MSAKIGFAELLHKALYSEKGFYERQSLEDHFITPSIGGARYAELLAEYGARHSLDHIIEYGAGTGQLAQHLAHLARKYQIVEKSSYCRTIQKERLVEISNIAWADAPCFKEKSLILIQEVFDCLEAPICCIQAGCFYELYYDQSQQRLSLEAIPEGSGTDKDIRHYTAFLNDYVTQDLWREGQLFILPSAACHWLLELYQKALEGSRVLIIDYGEAQPALAQKWQSTQLPLRAYRNHQLVNLDLSLLGSYDLTYDVDFYYLAACWLQYGGQVVNYEALGAWLAQRISTDQPSLKMLIEPRLMGQRFKVLELLR